MALELEKERREGRGPFSRFWRGVLVGVFAVLFLVTAAGYYTLRVKGLSIFIDQERLASSVKAKVRARLMQELPVVLNKLAGDATALLTSQMETPAMSVEIGERRLSLPPETAAFFQEQLDKAAHDNVQLALAKLDTAPYANELAEEAYRMVGQTLAEEVYGRTFRFQANRWLSLPITVHGNAD